MGQLCERLRAKTVPLRAKSRAELSGREDKIKKQVTSSPWHTVVMAGNSEHAERRAQYIAEELMVLRQRGLSALDVGTTKQIAKTPHELTLLAQQHADRLGKPWEQRGGVRRFFIDGLVVFGAEPEYEDDARLIDSLFFDRKGKRGTAGSRLKDTRDSLSVGSTKFRNDHQKPAFLSFARFLTSWDGSSPAVHHTASPTAFVPLQGLELENALKALGDVPHTTPILLGAKGTKLVVAINLFVVSLIGIILGGASWLARTLWDGNQRLVHENESVRTLKGSGEDKQNSAKPSWFERMGVHRLRDLSPVERTSRSSGSAGSSSSRVVPHCPRSAIHGRTPGVSLAPYFTSDVSVQRTNTGVIEAGAVDLECSQECR